MPSNSQGSDEVQNDILECLRGRPDARGKSSKQQHEGLTMKDGKDGIAARTAGQDKGHAQQDKKQGDGRKQYALSFFLQYDTMRLNVEQGTFCGKPQVKAERKARKRVVIIFCAASDKGCKRIVRTHKNRGLWAPARIFPAGQQVGMIAGGGGGRNSWKSGASTPEASVDAARLPIECLLDITHYIYQMLTIWSKRRHTCASWS